jgi:hypothetical protein
LHFQQVGPAVGSPNGCYLVQLRVPVSHTRAVLPYQRSGLLSLAFAKPITLNLEHRVSYILTQTPLNSLMVSPLKA